MAKKIFCTEEDIKRFEETTIKQIRTIGEHLKTHKFQNANEKKLSLTFAIDDTANDRIAYLFFTQKAWIKMYALVNNFSTEVEWHGTVRRLGNEAFMVEDILVFPHTATAVSVVSDQLSYQEWLDSLSDEQFNALRFHGHSHVNMGVTPSQIDETYRNKMLNNFGTPTPETDLYYIFLIANLRGDISAEIFDLQNNALYRSNEIDIQVQLGENEYLDDFVSQAKKIVKIGNLSNTNRNYGVGSTPSGTYGSESKVSESKMPVPGKYQVKK